MNGSGAGAAHLDDLGFDECVSRLSTKQVGRLAVVVDHYPQIFVVNYRMDDFVVVFRTNLGTKLLAAHHANIGFEVDDVDEVSRSGWTVVVQGMAEDVTDRDADPITERSRDLAVEPWAPGTRSRIVRIIPARITGRALTPGDLAV